MTLQEIITPWLNFISKRFAEKRGKTNINRAIQCIRLCNGDGVGEI